MLSYQDSVWVNLTTGFAWINIKSFVLGDPSASMDEALVHLLASPEYRDDYCARVNTEAGGPRHGPYWADAITTEKFTPVRAVEAATILRTWRAFWIWEDTTPEQRAEDDTCLEAATALVRDAVEIRMLLDLRAEAEHDYGWVLGGQGFHEFALLMGDGALKLLVASED